MDARKMKRFAAVLVAGAAGLATALTGCGGSEPSKTAGTPGSSASTAGAAATSALPVTVDVNNPTELAGALKALGVDTPATEPLGTDRGSGAEGAAFPTWPAGEVRKAGLSTFRFDISPDYGDDGTVKLMKGGKVLYESPAPVKAGGLDNYPSVPAAVVDALKVGDTVTWGVYFPAKKSKPATVSFTVVDKPAVTKAEAKLLGDKSLDPVVRDLARAQMLQNYGLHSEAVALFAGVLKTDGRVTSVYKSIATSLASLKLRNTPLFDLAKSRMLSEHGKAARPVVNPPTVSGAPGVVAPHPAGSAPTPGAAVPATPAAPPAGDAPVAGGSDPAPVLPVAPPSPTAPDGLPTAGPGVPAAPQDPSVPSHPTPPGPTHPTEPGPSHPVEPGPSHPAVPTPPHPADPATPAAPAAPGTPPGDPVPPGGVLPENPPVNPVQPENPPVNPVQPEPDPTPQPK